MSTDASDAESSKQLVLDLMHCATLVQKNQRSHPLLKQTLRRLTEYVATDNKNTSENNSASPASNTTENSNPIIITNSRSASPSTVVPPDAPQGTAPVPSAAAVPFVSSSPVLPSEAAKHAATAGPNNAPRVRVDGQQMSTAATLSANNTAAHNGSTQRSSEDSKDNWCSVHFCQNCACRKPKPRSGSKPAFCRPSQNSTSPLLANGWLEQQRRSKMRVVWKDVLASLVEGRTPKEETTLWIQREVPGTGSNQKPQLEALHQIPVRWIEKIALHGYSQDHRFSIKVRNVQEEFIFRCASDKDAAQQWVVTLRSVQERARLKHNERVDTRTTLDEVWDSDKPESSTNTGARSNQDKAQLEEKKQDTTTVHPAAPSYPPPPPPPSSSPPSQTHPPPSSATPPPPSARPPPPQPQSSVASEPPKIPTQQQPAQARMSISELRAIAHGAGVQTVGMERGQLEELVNNIQSSQKHPPPPPPPPPKAATPVPADHNSAAPVPPPQTPVETQHQRKQESAADFARRKQQEIETAKHEAAMRAKLAERAREHAAMEAKKRQAEEAERRKLAAERERKDAEEIQRKLTERQAAEVRRKAEEAQRQAQQNWQQQQQEWQRQQAEEEQRRRLAEQRETEEKRRQQHQQQWQTQQSQQQRPPPPPQTAPQYPQQQAPWQQQQHGQHPHMRPAQFSPQQGNFAGPPPPQGQAHPPSFTGQPPMNHYHHQQQQQQQQRPAGGAQQPPGVSQASLKYAKMAHVDDGERSVDAIKHGVLTQWALIPPTLQVLKPIDELILSIQKVFPPNFGVPGHKYFTKWKPITPQEISLGHTFGNRPDDAKMKKVMRKLRFFLHPDKLPNDLTKEQVFLCKLMWDIVSDAEADWKKKEEELGWING